MWLSTLLRTLLFYLFSLPIMKISRLTILAAPLLIASCQVVSGLSSLELDSEGARSDGDSDGAGGDAGKGGGGASPIDIGTGGNGTSASTGGAASGGSGTGGDQPEDTLCSSTELWRGDLDFTADPDVLWKGNKYTCTVPSLCKSFQPATAGTWQDYYTYVGLCGEESTCDGLAEWKESEPVADQERVQHLGLSYNCYAGSKDGTSGCSIVEPGAGEGAWTEVGSCATDCFNGVQDSDEACVDGGGLSCANRCTDGTSCGSNADCSSNYCFENFCSPSHCDNGIVDLGLGEVDQDCGGECPACADGKSCDNNDDCRGKKCDGTNTCIATTSCIYEWWLSPCLESNECDLAAGGGIAEGCRNLLDCYMENECDAASCSKNADDTCGQNNVQGGDPSGVARAQGVTACMCN